MNPIQQSLRDLEWLRELEIREALYVEKEQRETAALRRLVPEPPDSLYERWEG